MATQTFKGSCHCGAISVELAFTKDAAATQVRSCQCGFCTRHGSMTVSDPEGRATFDIAGDQLTTYEFATRTATSLVCRKCGVYVGALIEDGDKVWSIANVRGLGIPEFQGRTGEGQVYDQETPAQRIDRRKRRWTPTEIRFKL